jgi:predicted transcriptional regulator
MFLEMYKMQSTVPTIKTLLIRGATPVIINEICNQGEGCYPRDIYRKTDITYAYIHKVVKLLEEENFIIMRKEGRKQIITPDKKLFEINKYLQKIMGILK